MRTPLLPLIFNLRHLDGKGLWHILQEAESGRFVCSVTHRLQRWLSDKPGALLRPLQWRHVAGGWDAVSVLCTYSHAGHRPPTLGHFLQKVWKFRNQLLHRHRRHCREQAGWGYIQLLLSIRCLCVRGKHIQRHFTLLQQSEEKKNTSAISQELNVTSTFINYTAVTNVWRAETSPRGQHEGVGAAECGEFQRGEKTCDVINACLVLNTTNCFEWKRRKNE